MVDCSRFFHLAENKLKFWPNNVQIHCHIDLICFFRGMKQLLYLGPNQGQSARIKVFGVKIRVSQNKWSESSSVFMSKIQVRPHGDRIIQVRPHGDRIIQVRPHGDRIGVKPYLESKWRSVLFRVFDFRFNFFIIFSLWLKLTRNNLSSWEIDVAFSSIIYNIHWILSIIIYMLLFRYKPIWTQ